MNGFGERIRGRTASFVLTVLAAAALSACSRTVNYDTDLSATRGLKAGDAVVLNSARIGEVTAVGPFAGGKSRVTLAVDRSHADEIRSDSILVLNTDNSTPRLDLMNPEPAGTPAAPGSTIDGAICPKAAQRVIAGRGIRSFAAGLAVALSAFGANAQAPASSADLNQLQQQLAEIEHEAARGSAASPEAMNQQWQRLASELKQIEQRLVREGNSAEAERLRRELESFARGFGTPPNTLTVPRAY